MKNLGILISGRGSNMESILKAIKKQKIPINPAVVISNKSNAKGLTIAKKMGVQTVVIDSSKYKGNRLQFDKEIISILRKYKVTPTNGLVCLAGFMRIISPYFIKEYKNKILNIHPALLPAFPGLDAQKQAIEFGAKYSGCTVHFVDEGVDTGPIIIQEIVKIGNNDTEKTLTKKILVKEFDKLEVKDAVDFATNLVTWADVIRKSFFEGAIDELISTRRLVHIAQAYKMFDNKLKAIEMCVARFDSETKATFLDLYTKVDAEAEAYEDAIDEEEQLILENLEENSIVFSPYKPFQLLLQEGAVNLV